MLYVGRQPYGTKLKNAVRYPYRPISTWLIDLITRYGVDNLLELRVYKYMHHCFYLSASNQ